MVIVALGAVVARWAHDVPNSEDPSVHWGPRLQIARQENAIKDESPEAKRRRFNDEALRTGDPPIGTDGLQFELPAQMTPHFLRAFCDLSPGLTGEEASAIAKSCPNFIEADFQFRATAVCQFWQIVREATDDRIDGPELSRRMRRAITAHRATVEALLSNERRVVEAELTPSLGSQRATRIAHGSLSPSNARPVSDAWGI